MACKEVRKELNGKQLFCRQWTATKAMIMKAQLVDIGGEHILPFVEGRPDLVSMIRLEQRAKPIELVNIIKEFVCTVRIDGEEILPSNFDEKFSGDLWEIVEIFAFACEVNFKDFFEQGAKSLNVPQPQ